MVTSSRWRLSTAAQARRYVGGDFYNVGGIEACNIARWDGSSWSALGNDVDDTVRALATFDDGTDSSSLEASP